MNIRELIEQLEDLANEHGDDVEVRFAHQPSWPFEYAISRVEAVNVSEDDEGYGDKVEEVESGAVVVYLAEGSQLGYLPGAAAQVLGWGR
jgi:hypothetical protein